MTARRACRRFNVGVRLLAVSFRLRTMLNIIDSLRNSGLLSRLALAIFGTLNM